MRRVKKVIAIVGALIVSVSGCGQPTVNEHSKPGPQAPSVSLKDKYKDRSQQHSLHQYCWLARNGIVQGNGLHDFTTYAFEIASVGAIVSIATLVASETTRPHFVLCKGFSSTLRNSIGVPSD
jgi:hypothetical protein